MSTSNPGGREAMICRNCGETDRASEGYPCAGCGTFLCLMCTMRDIRYCKECQKKYPQGTTQK